MEISKALVTSNPIEETMTARMALRRLNSSRPDGTPLAGALSSPCVISLAGYRRAPATDQRML